MTTLEFDNFRSGGLPFSGAVKIRAGQESGCCGCETQDSSIIAIFSNGACVDLWKCQGCQCLQIPVQPLTVPPLSAALLVPGATLPEEVCDRCCYSRLIPDGSGGFSDAWDKATPIGRPALDNIVLGMQNKALQTAIDILEKQAASKVKVAEKVLVVVDPFELYISGLQAPCR